MSQQFPVQVVPPGFHLVVISPAIDIIVEALEPDKPGQFVALFFVVLRHDPLDVLENLLHVVDHVPVEHAAVLLDLGRLHIHVEFAILPLGDDEVVDLFRPGARRAEIGVETPAAPGGLDDQDRFAEQLLHGDAERELRSDLVLRGAEAGGQFALRLLQIGVGIPEAADRGDPNLVADPGFAVGAAHLLQERGRLGVVGH